MFRLAALVRDRAYAPYSGFKVGAAVRSADGEVFIGNNVENVHFKSVCAEVSAISMMIAAGHRRLKDVVIASPNKRLCLPCGNCRQHIFEFKEDDVNIFCFNVDGDNVRHYVISELLPESFQM
jgi:homotetrameric cytidine deaminase